MDPGYWGRNLVTSRVLIDGEKEGTERLGKEGAFVGSRVRLEPGSRGAGAAQCDSPGCILMFPRPMTALSKIPERGSAGLAVHCENLTRAFILGSARITCFCWCVPH